MRRFSLLLTAILVTGCGGSSTEANPHGLPRVFALGDVSPGADVAHTADSTLSVFYMIVTMMRDGTFRMETDYEIDYQGSQAGRAPHITHEVTDWGFAISGSQLVIQHPLDAANNTQQVLPWDDSFRQVELSVRRVFDPWHGVSLPFARTLIILQTN